MHLKVVKSGTKYKIRNVQANKTYKTTYNTKSAAERKMRIMEDWFFQNKIRRPK